MSELLLPLGVALGMGLLVGFQRERTRDRLAGVRTFGLISLAGALCAQLAAQLGSPWLVAAGLLALAALVTVAGGPGSGPEDADPGITTEVATLVMFLVGAVAGGGRLALAVVTGGVVAVLLHFKRPMHGLARRLREEEVRAVMRIVVIALVILPVLPDRTYGPHDVLNPFRIWLMVVLIVGISVLSYVAHRLADARTGSLLGGVLGGLISSTATTVSYARRARDDAAFARVAASVVMIASTVLFARVFLEVAIVAPRLLRAIAAPLGLAAVFHVGASALGFARIRGQGAAAGGSEDPAQLSAALVFAALYGLVLFAVAAAREAFGEAGLYAVAAVSGLTDVDAITLSMANLAEAGRVESGTAWRAILLATLANLGLKTGLCLVLGGPPLLRAVAPLVAPALGGGAGVLLLWP